MGIFDFFKDIFSLNKKLEISNEVWPPPVSQKWIQERRELAETIINNLSNSGYFKPEKIPQLVEKFKTALESSYDYKDPFNYNECLTLEEKRSYKLNTRQKISREMINFMTDTGLRHE